MTACFVQMHCEVRVDCTPAESLPLPEICPALDVSTSGPQVQKRVPHQTANADRFADTDLHPHHRLQPIPVDAKRNLTLPDSSEAGRLLHHDATSRQRSLLARISIRQK